MRKTLNYFTLFEKLLWAGSVTVIVAAFLLFGKNEYLTLAASLIGITFLILNAKGNPLGQFLTIVFSVLYGKISYSFAYYGEMITYLGMTAPMALFALISWLRHPFEGRRSQVEVNSLKKTEIVFMLFLTAGVTALFYFILGYFNTANLIPGTVSVTTSFIAVYLTFRRSPYFALAYAANDLVLILLWALASREDKGYIPVLVCFTVFFINDLYGFVNWMKMKKNQSEKTVNMDLC